MATDLTRIGEKARKEPKLVFSSLYHHVYDVDNLRACYETLEAGKATGVDGVDKEEYGKKLEENLQDLSRRLREMGYRPAPKRRSYIPKAGSEKGRPLGISCLEDKIVEEAAKRCLEPIYEADFKDSSYGYRPGRSQHMCVDALGRAIQQKKVNYIVEADIKGFFDTVEHEWMIKFLKHRIADERVIRLITRMLKSGIMEEGIKQETGQGTPQGSILSPLLSNIYLHYVLDTWFNGRVRKESQGEAYYFRYADDFVGCFEYKEEAEGFRKRLADRLEGFGLEVAEEKTKCIRFGKYARRDARKKGERVEEFTFLGFTFYCGSTKYGSFKLKRKTSRKKLAGSLRNFSEWARKSKNFLKKGEMLRRAKSRVVGHLNYYAITDNMERCNYYVYSTTRTLYKWMNRKSQKRAYTWVTFKQALDWVGWPRPRICKNLDPFRRAEVF